MYFWARHRESSEDLPDLRQKNSVLVYSSSAVEYKYGSNKGYYICTRLCVVMLSVFIYNYNYSGIENQVMSRHLTVCLD